MSYTETDYQYEDDILRLARDPNLNREKGKTLQLVLIIQGFPLTERAVSRLCQLSLSILQTLEKIELTLRNWAFMSLDLNSSNHFDHSNPHEIKTFNNNVSVRVIDSCQELTMKLNKISADMDFITKSLRTLTPREFLSDSGTLLTSLSLRSIKLKDQLREKISIAYLKAKLITIGMDLESMLQGGTSDQKATVESYKQFVASLLGQLNAAVEAQDDEQKNECMAVINDMEQMFEVFKLEYAQGLNEEPSAYAESSEQQVHSPLLFSASSKHEEFSDLEDLTDTASTTHSNSQIYSQPMVHSITKPHTPTTDEGSVVEQHARRSSFSSVASTNVLQKSTISEELPYLMSAFSLAKTLEEDVHHFKDSGEKEETAPTNAAQIKSDKQTAEAHTQKQFSSTRHHLPKSSLYSSSQILQAPPAGSASSYLYSNNSLLSKLGIKPQVISATLPNPQQSTFGIGRHNVFAQRTNAIEAAAQRKSDDQEDKENKVELMVPLTRANLNTHTLAAFGPGTADHVE
ncbi:hypothetical protein METBIDRAFT_78662 [Metschnikowia bicuspidata var. bicuspidata NRRL YB-4993]|uniref:Uncharacterized protein n=1 Tax=Metschnikowia bicuspidata var. bicuspidata NRRL YB-4993 TaxID=869754 RepID=A0A1A0H8J8_9ASCO|nr:hypothetical protein METBIDRAFT_78662 [Metschnikowia bicuspidata var. bicuspidata NRRL YB-4993]OBA20208.1 hypothetical protein METBIDRAFT_78662 [Metschnikowia bicuspidata var. bicuspidata NRRL YB-4993]